MRLIGGSTRSLVLQAPLPGQSCPACAARGQVAVGIYSRYVHLYYIPAFPTGKRVLVYCGHCRLSWKDGGIPDEFEAPVRALRQQVRVPLRHWLGVALLAGGLGAAAVTSEQDDRQDRRYLAAPLAGDVYTVPGDSIGYASLLRVRHVYGNTIELVANRFSSRGNNPVTDLNQAARYDTTAITLTQFDLQIMYNKGDITEVDRPGDAPADPLTQLEHWAAASERPRK